MNLSELFIRRPVTTVLVMTGILFFGITAYRRLPVSDLPTVDFPTITVNASLPGASPETMASAVATPLEKQFSTIAGIDNMTSTSSLGACNITIQFSLDRNIDAAAQDVQAMIAKTLKNLPPGIIPPSYQKVNPADQPIVFYGFTSNLMPISQLDEYAETFMAQRISMIPGVAQVNVYGSAKYAVRIQLDPSALAQPPDRHRRSRGRDQRPERQSADGRAQRPEQDVHGAGERPAARTRRRSASMVVDVSQRRAGASGRHRPGARRHPEQQVDRVVRAKNDSRAASSSPFSASPGTNTVAVADAVKATMKQLQKQIPASVNMTLMYDRAATIRESVRDVKFTLVLTLCLVIAVIFLFLRNVSATLIPSLALPISVIGTFAVMYLLDYSLDNLSLMALTLAVGFVVDDAIVMLENIVRHMEMGKPPMRAAMDGAAEVGFTILSMTISLTAVFIPILFLGGIVGRLFHEFAVVIAVSILVSGFVSLTLTPMLSSRFLRPHEHDEKHGRVYKITEAGYDWLLAKYESSLEWVMNHRPLDDGVLVRDPGRHRRALHAHSERVHPEPGHGQLFVTTETAQGTSFDDMVTHQKQVTAILSRGHEHRRLLVGDRRQLHRLRHEPGASAHRPQAARRACQRRRDDQGAPTEAREDSGHRRLHAEPAADSDRRTRVEESVSVHDAELGHRDAVSGGRRAGRAGA